MGLNLPRVFCQESPPQKCRFCRGGFTHPVNRGGFATHSSPVGCWSFGMSFLTLNKYPSRGRLSFRCHAVRQPKNPGFSWQECGRKWGHGGILQTLYFVSRTHKDLSCNIFFHLALSSTFPASVWEDMKERFPTFLIITQGECNIQWELKWFII